MRFLTDLEQAILGALTDHPVSTSVIKYRAGVPVSQRNGPTLAACLELERQGLARSVGSGLSRRWSLPDRTDTPQSISA